MTARKAFRIFLVNYRQIRVLTWELPSTVNLVENQVIEYDNKFYIFQYLLPNELAAQFQETGKIVVETI